MNDFTLELVASTPDPFGDANTVDEPLDALTVLNDIDHIVGDETVEHDENGTYAWRGRLVNANRVRASTLPEYPAIEEQIEHVVAQLMDAFPVDAVTPDDTDPHAYDWAVTVHDMNDRAPIYSGRRVQVVWSGPA